MNKKTILTIIGVAVISIFIIMIIIVRNTATSELSRDTNYTTTTTTTTNNNSSTNKKNNNSTTNKNTSKGCGFKYSNGSTCGRTVGSHSPLCDYHFYQLDSTYKDLVGE